MKSVKDLGPKEVIYKDIPGYEGCTWFLIWGM